jgi:hypothetical protein
VGAAAVIVTLALLAFAYYRSTSGSTSLAAIGLLAFAAVAQFARHFRGTVLERRQPQRRVLGHADRLHRPGRTFCSCPIWWRAAYSHGAGRLRWAHARSLLPHALTDYSTPGAVGPRAHAGARLERVRHGDRLGAGAA